jgi:hypothetical protein
MGVGSRCPAADRASAARRSKVMDGGTMSTSAVEHTDEPDELHEEHFKPTGTVFVLVLFVATIILLWASVYVILLSRGVTV